MYPIFLKIGPLEIRFYGIMIALAVLTGTVMGVKEAKRRGWDPELIYDFVLYAMIAGIVGARLYYVAASAPLWYLRHPLEIPAVWHGGLSVHGGLLGGLLAGIWFCRKRKIAFWSFADLATPALILAQAVGRGACILNGCSYGKPTTLPWAITFTNPASMAPHDIPLHPTQWYELTTDLMVFSLIWFLRTRTRFPGQLFLIYGVSYGVTRFVLEFFRGDSLLVAGLFPVPQAMSVVLLLASLSFYMAQRKTA